MPPPKMARTHAIVHLWNSYNFDISAFSKTYAPGATCGRARSGGSTVDPAQYCVPKRGDGYDKHSPPEHYHDGHFYVGAGTCLLRGRHRLHLRLRTAVR